MLELADLDRAAAIDHALAGASLLAELRSRHPAQPPWVAELEEQCCRYGAIWIHGQLGESGDPVQPAPALSEIEQAIGLLERLETFHSPPPDWISIFRDQLQDHLIQQTRTSTGAAHDEAAVEPMAGRDLLNQANAALALGGAALQVEGGVERLRSLAAACHKRMLNLAEGDRELAIGHATACAQLLQALHVTTDPQPPWLAAVEEQCCRYGAIWVHEQLGRARDAALLRTWIPEAILLLDRLETFHDPVPEWIDQLRRRLLEHSAPPTDWPDEAQPLPTIPEEIDAAAGLLPQARSWLSNARAAGAHERCLAWLEQLRAVLGDRPDLLWCTLDSSFPVGDWGLQAWCAEQLLQTTGPEQGPVHRHLLLTRWQALLTMATAPRMGERDDATGALLALANAPPALDSQDAAALHPHAWLLLQSARLAQRRGYLASARQLYQAVGAMPDDAAPLTLRVPALEMAELIAYVQGDLPEGMATRERLTRLTGSTTGTHPDPFRDWRMELGADPSALDHWRSLRASPAGRRLAPLGQAIQAHPCATALGFGLLHTLQEAGAIGHERLVEQPGAAIPRRLWLLRRGPGAGLEYDERARRWAMLHPGWDCEWLEPHHDAIASRGDLPALVRAACRAVNAPDVRADLLRLALLWEHGGLSLNWDTRPQRSLAPLVEPGTTLLLVTDHLGCLDLDAIAALPRHPLVRMALETACRRVLAGEGFSRWEFTGAAMLNGVFSRWMAPQLDAMDPAEPRLPPGLKVLAWAELQNWLSLGIPLGSAPPQPAEPAGQEVINTRQRLRALRALSR